MAAGYRPGTMGLRGEPRPSRVKRLIVIAVLVLVIASIVSYFAVPPVRERVDALINQAKVAFVLFQNPSGNAIDQNASSAWLADPSAGTPTLEVPFKQPTDLAGFTFTGGGQPGDDFANHARPRHIQFVFPGDPPQTETFELQDSPAPQKECLQHNHNVLSFDIRIVDTYPPATGGENLVPVREISFISGSC